MRIGLSLFQFYPGRVGGAGEYVQQLVPRLTRMLGRDDRLILCGSRENLTPFDDLRDARLERREFTLSRLAGKGLRLGDLATGGRLSRFLAAKINAARPDVMLFPQQALFPQGIDAPRVVTFVDLQHEHFPQYFSRFGLWSRRKKERQAVAGADRFICISAATRDDLVRILSVPRERTHVVYLGGDAAGDRPVPPRASSSGTVPYVLYPANAYPHKNHVRLVRGFRRFRGAHPDVPAKLILSGLSNRELDRELAAREPDEGIEHVGFVSRAQLDALYAGCRGVIFPSLFEGFGIPVLEALRHGRPVVCADLPVFREIVGDAVEYFDPGSEEAIADQLQRIFCAPLRTVDPAVWENLQARFSWDRCAEETLAVLRIAATTPGEAHAMQQSSMKTV